MRCVALALCAVVASTAVAASSTVTLSAKYLELKIGNTTCDVTKDPFNAKGDGKVVTHVVYHCVVCCVTVCSGEWSNSTYHCVVCQHNDTAAIASALSKCGGGDGGIVVVPKGTYLIGSTLQFTQSHTQLRIEDGATLLVSDDMEKWPDNQAQSSH